MCVCVCFVCGGGGSWGEWTHVDKSYSHQSGPPHYMPKSVVPLITRGRHPNCTPHTAPFIPTDRFTQQTFCFRAARLVIGSGHTTQTLTPATLEPLSHPSTSTSHRHGLHNAHTVPMLKWSSVGRWGAEYGTTPGMSPKAERTKDPLLLRHDVYPLKVINRNIFMEINVFSSFWKLSH